MGAPEMPAGYSVVGFGVIDSTNEEAKRRAVAGARGPTWIWARRQTAGRGRRGRDWNSPEGNLMATLLLVPDVKAAEAAKLSFVAALAVHDVVLRWAPGAHVRVKWPNDVLVEGRKIAGILLEASSEESSSKLPWLAAGIGINLAHAPQEALYPATYVNAHGAAPDVPEALSDLAQAWETRFRMWKLNGFEAIRQSWLGVAAGVGQPAEVRLARETIFGTIETLMLDGALSLILPSGARRAITAGEVFFPLADGVPDASGD